LIFGYRASRCSSLPVFSLTVLPGRWSKDGDFSQQIRGPSPEGCARSPFHWQQFLCSLKSYPGILAPFPWLLPVALVRQPRLWKKNSYPVLNFPSAPQVGRVSFDSSRRSFKGWLSQLPQELGRPFSSLCSWRFPVCLLIPHPSPARLQRFL